MTSVALDTTSSHPQQRGAALPPKDPFLAISCTPFHSVPVTQPQPSPQQDHHSYLVLWGPPVAWQVLVLRGKGTDVGRPSPIPGLPSSSWLPW